MKLLLDARAARLYSAAIFVLLAALVIGVWNFLRVQERALTYGAVALAADQTARYAEDYLAMRMMAVSQLAAFWTGGKVPSPDDFVHAATRIEAQFPGIHSINVVSNAGVIQQVAPVQGNRQALGLDVGSHPFGRYALTRARASGRWAAAQPFDLVQGGRGVVALLPVGRGSAQPAFLQLVIRLDELARRVLQMSDTARVAMSIVDQDAAVLHVGDDAAAGPRIERDIRFADRTWTIRLAPAQIPMMRVASIVPLAVGLFLVLLAAMLVDQAIRRNAELRASEKRFRNYAEAASDWFWEIDRHGRLTYLSRSFEALTGTPIEPFIGRPIAELSAVLDLRTPEGRPLRPNGAPNSPAGTALHRMRAPDDQDVMLLTRWHAIRNAGGQVQGYRGAVTDLRRETAAYDRAVLAEHRLHHAIQSISQGFALFDGEERLALCNDRYLSFLPDAVRPRIVPGVAHEEVIAMLVESGWFGAEYRAERWRDLFHAGVGSVEYQPPGRPWMQISYGRTDEAGRVVVVTDISELKRREAAIRDREERYRSLVDGSIQGIMVYRRGRVLFANRTAAATLGFTRAEDVVALTDLSPLRFLSAPESEPANPLLTELGQGEVRDVEVEAARLDGAPLWLVVRASRVDWDDGPATQMTLFDGTGHKQVERSLLAAKEQAEYASRAKSTFLAQMSHELRTPLNAVIGFSEILQQEMLGPLGNPRYREYADDIAASGRHLLAVINDILDVAKFEAGRLTLQESRISLAEIIQSSLRMLHERAEAGAVTLESILPSDVPPICGDHSKIKQILLNLLSNALKFTPPGGQVVVAARCEGDGAIAVSVRDTGLGMAADDIPRALEPFTQVGSAAMTQQQGTGLGLPLAKAFTQLHGGALNIESTPGRGTCVTFRLPPHRVLWDAAA